MQQDYAKNRWVAESFYQHTLGAAMGSGFPVLEVNDAQQRGRTFGKRLANAFADAFAKGYDHVIAVGSDCPRLHEVDWQAVAERVQEGAPVLGPTSERDGVYLIGLSRAQFHREAFAALPWKQPAVFSALLHHLSEQAETVPALLSPRDDVNSHGELVALIRRDVARLGGLLVRLRVVLGPLRHAIREREAVARICVRTSQSRDPPGIRRGRMIGSSP